MRPYPSILYGFLPVTILARLLKEPMEEGRARLSALAHQHIAQDHLEDYEFCLHYMAQAIENPTFAGKAPWHIRNFELVKQVEEHNLLIALGIEPNAHGNYAIRSAYRITSRQVRERLRDRHLFVV
jgi:hypothetical protein